MARIWLTARHRPSESAASTAAPWIAMVAMAISVARVFAGGGPTPHTADTRTGLAPAVEAMPVPAALQVPLLLKILTYDRNFSARTASGLRIAIIFISASAESTRARDEIADALTGLTVKNVPIRHTTLESVSDGQVAATARADQVNIFYLTPGIGAHLGSLLRIGVERQIITTTGVPAYVDQGVAVGVGIKQDKPYILINLPTSKAVGTEFDASLLRIAKVVR
jgi:hypothetical protein